MKYQQAIELLVCGMLTINEVRRSEDLRDIEFPETSLAPEVVAKFKAGLPDGCIEVSGQLIDMEGQRKE